jgi:hypothetical protein
VRQAAAAALAGLLALTAPAQAQRGPDDGPDLIISGEGGPDWLVACEGRTIFGDRLAGAAGGPARAPGPVAEFARVGLLVCRIEGGSRGAIVRVEKTGGEPFCPLTGQPGQGPCEVRFAPGEAGEFEFEAVP